MLLTEHCDRRGISWLECGLYLETFVEHPSANSATSKMGVKRSSLGHSQSNLEHGRKQRRHGGDWSAERKQSRQTSHRVSNLGACSDRVVC